MRQYQGLEDGYRASTMSTSPKDIPHFFVQLLNGCGDLFTIIPHVRPSARTDFERTSMAKLQAMRGSWRDPDTCSALIKLTDDFSDMFIGHSAWFVYGSMLRIWKTYTFNVAEASTSAKRVSFSSYPGYLESLDDFYMMSSGLAMVQTTNGIYNNTLYDLVSHESMLAWQRVRIANSMAGSGPAWREAFKTASSGTYQNMYMVVDLNLFTPGRMLPPNTLWVVEEVPGLNVGSDQTAVLAAGYWASYNRPFHWSIFSISGYPEMAAKYGDDYTYDLCPRAEIFRRDQHKAVDLESFKTLMRSNDYKTDPFSHGDPNHAICSRGDLGSPPSAGGCYDNKATSAKLFWAMTAHVINGPTTAGGTLPPFQWAGSGLSGTEHLGLPPRFNFSYVQVKPFF
jgi:hypothetical protein